MNYLRSCWEVLRGAILIVLLITMSFEVCFAQEKVINIGKQEKLNISQYVDYLEDASNQLRIEDIILPSTQSKFIASQQQLLDFAFTKSTYWIRLTINQQENPNTTYLLMVSNPDLDYAAFYLQDSTGKWKENLNGDMRPYKVRLFQHRYLVFPLTHSFAPKQTYYLKVNGASPLIIPLEIIALHRFYIKDVKTQFFYGLFAGVLLLIVFNNIIAFFLFKDNTYLIYLLYVLLTLLVVMNTSGHLSQLYFQSYGAWKNDIYFILILSVVIFSSLFGISFLKLKENAPLMYKITLSLFVFDVLLVISKFFLPFQTVFLILTLRATVPFPILFISSFIVWCKGNSYVGYYFIGYILYFIGIIAQVDGMYNNGNDLARLHGVELGIFFEIIFLAIALNVKYYQERRNTQRAKANAQNELIRIQEEANRSLEQKIRERTKTIQEQAEEIVAQNEELQQSREEIAIQKDILQEQHAQLSTYTNNLEKLVQERTKQIEATNQELINQNIQLEQYAFITAHNLRAPIARLLGLTNLFDIKNLQNEFNATLIDKIQLTSQNLDDVIKDLNMILEIKKGANKLEKVRVSEKIDKVLQILHQPIKETQAQIQINLAQVDEILAVGVYIESILYNLLSNALKYRDINRTLQIKIKAHQLNNDFICLSIEDNGLGIDLSLHGEKIFGMYKRFHLHTEGKGLGLHLIKTQVEAIGGEIQVKSEINKGSIFYVYLKALSPKDEDLK
jgi:signal transduction histidine kinase